MSISVFKRNEIVRGSPGNVPVFDINAERTHKDDVAFFANVPLNNRRTFVGLSGSIGPILEFCTEQSPEFSRCGPVQMPACRKASLNHVGGCHKQSIGQREPQRLGRVFIEDEFDLCRFFDREISGFGALQNLVYENSRTATHRRLVSSIGH